MAPNVWRRLCLLVMVGMLSATPAMAAVPEAARGGPENGELPAPSSGPAGPISGRMGLLNVMIELADPPASVAYGRAKDRGAPKAAVTQAGRDQHARNDRAQQVVVQTLNNAHLNTRLLYRVQNAYNGIAASVDAKDVGRIRRLPGVTDVHLLRTMERTNASSVPLIGAPVAWTSYGETGAGVKIGIIDTGIDYVHTNFGGSGSSADYSAANDPANNPATTNPAPSGFKVMSGGRQIFPSPKVVGGFDFAGDAYNADAAGSASTPQPDPNPMDCTSSLGGGHGSHVAGTAAGYGVSADGTTYRGAYDTSVPFDSMRIGPGVAPNAQLYALRVFGCAGSTNLTVQAIDWAVDPNQDGDFSDHLDVINMSLGSAYGGPDDESAVASDNAAQAGVVVVVSAGNEGDLYYVAGSPGSSIRALTVASSVDSTDVVDGFRVNNPATIAGIKPASFSANYNWTSPPTANPVPVTRTVVYPGTNRTGCSAFTGADAALVSDSIVLLDWAPAGTSNFPCGSAARAGNAAAAGAKGVIMVSGQPFFDTTIAGNSTIPAVFTTSTVGDSLKANLTPGGASSVDVTLSNEFANGVKVVDPSRNDTLSSFSSRGPRHGDNMLKPDIAAPGQTIFSTDSGSGNRGRTLSGTSMAAPHMSGVMALLRDQHPDWTVEELKALAMNTAAKDLFIDPGHTAKYAPARVGAGRVDVPAAMADSVIAYNDEDAGAVSVSFGAVEVLGTASLVKTVRVSNKGRSSVTYNLAYDSYTDIPGVSYSFPGGSAITVPAGGAATFRVQLTADATRMKNSRDATVTGTQGATPRQWLSEASGIITLRPLTGPILRVPVYAIARPASDMSTTQKTLTMSAPWGTTALNMVGQGVNTGSAYPSDLVSLVTPMELQGISPPLDLSTIPGATERDREADLQYVGVTTDAKARVAAGQPVSNSVIYFGITTYGNWSAPALEAEFDIYIDADHDGTDDYVLYNTRQPGADIFVSVLYDLGHRTSSLQGFSNVFSSNQPTAIFNSNTLVMPVNAAALHQTAPNTRFSYHVDAFAGRFNDSVDSAGPFSFDFASPGLDFTDGTTGVPTRLDLPGSFIPVGYNKVDFNANHSLGALLIHHFNATGKRAQAILWLQHGVFLPVVRR